MTSELDATFGPHAWKPFPRDLPGLKGAVVLMDASDGFRTPRSLGSKQDVFFVVGAVRELYPDDELREVTVGGRKYLARRDEYGSEF